MEMVKVEGTRAADEPSGSEEEDEEDEEEEEEGEEEMTEEKDEDECQPGPSNQTTRRSQEASENGEMEQGEEAERAEEEHCQSGPSQRATCEMTRGGEMVQEPALGALQVPTCRLDDDLEPEDGELSPASPRSRPVSRSPPQSRSPSPESLSMMMASLNLSAQRRGIKEVVSSDISRQRARQQRKYHSKRGSARQGRPRGSKAKQDPRVHIDKGDLW
jgi:RIO kinase 2